MINPGLVFVVAVVRKHNLSLLCKFKDITLCMSFLDVTCLISYNSKVISCHADIRSLYDNGPSISAVRFISPKVKAGWLFYLYLQTILHVLVRGDPGLLSM